MNSYRWLITDHSNPPLDYEETDQIDARVPHIDDAVAAFERLRTTGEHFLILTDEVTKLWFMIGLGSTSAYIRYVSPEAPHCAVRLLPVTPLVAQRLRFSAEQDDVDVPPERLLTIEQFYELLRHFDAHGDFPAWVKTQYDWEP